MLTANYKFSEKLLFCIIEFIGDQKSCWAWTYPLPFEYDLHTSKLVLQCGKWIIKYYWYTIFNKSWWQHPTRHQLYGHLPPITKTIQVRRTRHAGHCWRSRDELISDVLLWTPTYGRAKAGQSAQTYIQQLCEDTNVALKTCQRRWTIGKSGERGSGISMLVAWHDDDDDDGIPSKI